MAHRKIATKGLRIAFAAIITAPLAVALTATPAQAISCSSPDSGIWATVKTLPHTVSSRSPSAVTVLLRNERNNDESTAHVSGNLESGDRVWVERKSGSTWEQCPKTNITAGNETYWTAKYAAGNVGTYMRACFDYPVLSYRNVVCTAQYYDAD
ncbi:hypothetical protein ACFY2Q_24950 [Micromonospora sp. NPDC000316]|uniref:hypothetical protein n=1 Tax=Micromonospora sp. NPDC000316 TaxID=3364216 RepID=UPI0036C177F2